MTDRPLHDNGPQTSLLDSSVTVVETREKHDKLHWFFFLVTDWIMFSFKSRNNHLKFLKPPTKKLPVLNFGYLSAFEIDG